MSRQLRYFVNYHTRMIRTIDLGDREPPEQWVEVIAQGYDQFRKITKIFFTSSTERQARKLGNGMELKLKGIKRRATKMKKAAKAEGRELTHTQALEIVAVEAGYRNYHEARIALGDPDD